MHRIQASLFEHGQFLLKSSMVGGVSPANGMATAVDWMSAATFISMAGTVAISDYDGSRFLMGWTGGFVLLTMLMVPYSA